jgi:hypothetical protein
MAPRDAAAENRDMLRYQCRRCHEVTHREEPTSHCGICFAPLSDDDLLPAAEPPPQSRSLAELLNARDAARDAARAAYSLPG